MANDLNRQKLRWKAVLKKVKSAINAIQLELQKPVISEEQLSDEIARITAREKKLVNLNCLIFDLTSDDDDLAEELA